MQIYLEALYFTVGDGKPVPYNNLNENNSLVEIPYEKHILSKDCFCIEIFCNILYNEYIFSLKEVSQ